MHLLEKWDAPVESFRQNQSIVPALFKNGENGEIDGSNRIVAIADGLTAEERSKRKDKRKKKELDWSKVKEPSNPIALRAVEEF